MKTQCHDGFTKILYGVIATFVLFATLLNSEARGATYYLSPNGSDSGFGTSSGSPWRTFSFAIPKLSPGDTLILANGTYSGSTSGFPYIGCGTNAANGTTMQPITVRAENERQAFLQGTGREQVLHIKSCAYWTFEGLRLASADVANSPGLGFPVLVENSDHLILRRLLVSHNNRYANTHVLKLVNTHNSLIEENEGYFFHRHGISMSSCDNNIVRRNYMNARNHADIPGGYPSDPTNNGDPGIVLYPGKNNVVENNIIENSGVGLQLEAYGTAINNKFLGNISLNTQFGAIFHARGNTPDFMPQDNLLKNQVSLNSVFYGGYFRSAKNTQCNNCSALGSQVGGFAADEQAVEGDGLPSVFYENSLAVNNAGYGFLFQDQNDFGVDYSYAIGQSKNFSPPNNITNNLTLDPNPDPGLGSCKVFIPDTSPLKGAGKNGSDIGANVLYRYQDGVLTDTPLWSVDTGMFTCGTQVAGVNDIAGSSCFDVHKRLNVNTNGCLLPEGYGGKEANSDNEPPLTPINVKIVN